MGLIVTTTFSFVLIPLLTEAIEQRNQIKMNRYANASLKITILISSAAGIGLINLLPMMNAVFFKTNSLGFTLSIVNGYLCIAYNDGYCIITSTQLHSSDIDWCNYWLSSESDTQRPIDSSLWYCWR